MVCIKGGNFQRKTGELLNLITRDTKINPSKDAENGLKTVVAEKHSPIGKRGEAECNSELDQPIWSAKTKPKWKSETREDLNNPITH